MRLLHLVAMKWLMAFESPKCKKLTSHTSSGIATYNTVVSCVTVVSVEEWFMLTVISLTFKIAPWLWCQERERKKAYFWCVREKKLKTIYYCIELLVMDLMNATNANEDSWLGTLSKFFFLSLITLERTFVSLNLFQ